MRNIYYIIEKLFLFLFYLIVVAIFLISGYIIFTSMNIGASRGVIMGSFLFTVIILALSLLSLLSNKN